MLNKKGKKHEWKHEKTKLRKPERQPHCMDKIQKTIYTDRTPGDLRLFLM